MNDNLKMNDLIDFLYVHTNKYIKPFIKDFSTSEFAYLQENDRILGLSLCFVSLDLSKNGINQLVRLLSKFTHLKKLSFSWTYFPAISELIVSFEKLEELYINEQCFTNLPDNIAKLNKLKRLELTNCFTFSLPENIGKLSKLEHFNLWNNRIRELPSSIGDLNNLKFLDITNTTKMVNLPSSIINLTKLEYFRYRRIKFTEEQTRWLSNLKKRGGIKINFIYYRLSEDILRSIDSDEQLIEELNKTLELNYSLTIDEVDFFDVGINGYVMEDNKVIALSVDNVPLHTLPKKIGYFKNIEKLALTNTGLNVTFDAPFLLLTELPNLKYLYLDNNSFFSLTSNISKLTNLSTLSLKSNNFNTIPSYLFKLNNLKELYISSNNLRSMSPDIGKMENLEILYIETTSHEFNSQPDSITNLNNLNKLVLKCKYLRLTPQQQTWSAQIK